VTGLELAVILGAALLGGGVIADRLRIPGPMVLLVLGAALSFVPGLSGIALPPEVVLLLFLPVLLYWESLNTSLREIRANLRVILLLAVGLVVATALVIALIARAFGFDWTTAIVLGAILAPTDATAVAALVGRLPRRAATILRAESLINDATALALYSVAVSALMAGRMVNGVDVSLRFVYALVVGTALGLLVALIIWGIRKILRTTVQHNTLSVLSPFLLYLPAELLDASAVVSVVAGGLMLSQVGPRALPPRSRQQGYDFWRVSTYLVNGGLFLLIGLQLRPTIATLASDGWRSAIWLCVLCAAAVILTRHLWSNVTTALIRLLDRRPSQRARRVSFRGRLPIAWASFRGAVSLAAALSLPVEAAGHPLPHRATIIAATFTVVVVTLFLQGLTLPAVVRLSRLQRDPREDEETLLAKTESTQAALDRLDDEADRLGVDDDTRETVRADFQAKLDLETADDDGAGAAELQREHELRRALLHVKRETVIGLRDRRRIDDTVLRRMQAHLDAEELRLQGQADDD
jgi:monovalent cation/hydrogen antiporter